MATNKQAAAYAKRIADLEAENSAFRKPPMLLTDSAILEELVHAMYRTESQLGPRAQATLLIAKERLGIADVSKFQIEIDAFTSEKPRDVKIVTVQEYARMLERVLSKDGSGYEVLRVIHPNH